ncbi:MAG: hypothetical protein WCW30_01170 [Candidatus Gracilibacteria bacterium]|jgi:hypothetical protein
MKSLVKIVVYVPGSHADAIREALAKAGAGHIGNYDCCSFSVKGIGRFRGLEGTNPFIGTPGKLEEVEEERIETVCREKDLKKILGAVKKVHPYEEPAIDVFALMDNEKS